MYYLYFSFCQVLFGVGTHGRWSDLFLIFFFALWTPIGDIRGYSPKIRILHFQVVFFGVSPWNQITLAWLLCHLGLRDFWPAFAHCVVLPCQNLEPHLRLLRWSLVQSFFDFNPIADVGLYYWFVCRLQTWMNMFLCGSSMRKSQIKDLWQKPCYTQIGICNSNHANKGPRNRIKVHSLMYRYLLLIFKSKNQIFFELSKSNFTSLALLIFVNLLFKSE